MTQVTPFEVQAFVIWLVAGVILFFTANRIENTFWNGKRYPPRLRALWILGFVLFWGGAFWAFLSAYLNRGGVGFFAFSVALAAIGIALCFKVRLASTKIPKKS